MLPKSNLATKYPASAEILIARRSDPADWRAPDVNKGARGVGQGGPGRYARVSQKSTR